MNDWDLRAEKAELSRDESEDFIAARLRYFSAVKENSMALKQRSRVKWAVEGDENSSLFHGLIRGRSKRNTTKGIALNGEWLEDPLKLKRRYLVSIRGILAKHKLCVQLSPVENSRSFSKGK